MLDQFSAFRNAARDAVVSVEVSRSTDRPFKSYRVKQFALKQLKLCDVACDPICIDRSKSHIARDGVDDVLLMFQLAGEVAVGQNDQQFVVRTGDLAILQADSPYHVSYHQPCRRLFMSVPRQQFLPRLNSGIVLPAFRQLHKTPLGRIVSSVMLSVAADANDLDDKDGEVIAESLLDLLARLVRGDTGSGPPVPEMDTTETVDKAFDIMERHFADSELTPTQIADAVGISVRYLHALVSATGTTVGKWLWERRLLACYEALQNPLLHDKTITEIAFELGFSDAAHFSRAFKFRFGLTPRDVRKR
ncbi:MAG: helix-turn-helix domain-containing protein [Gammaproteobacteria bacterium]|nr:helix-turn-helix domain-containing protein [Gammaproteobacteria bacterium]